MISLLININKKIVYIFLFIFISCFISSNKLLALENYFLVKDLKLSEEFNLSFSKDKIIEKAFTSAFDELLMNILVSSDVKKIKNKNLKEIKQLVENFKIKDEEFKNNKYFATFDVNFNKKKIYRYIENNNLFISVPQNIKVLFLPIFINENKINLFNENFFYSNWLKHNNVKYLIEYILPLENINELENSFKKSENLEKLNMIEISKKYNLNNFILSLIYKKGNKLSIYSKVKFKENMSSTNLIFNDVDFNNKKSLYNHIEKIKVYYDDIWKFNNQINTSIKLSLNAIFNTKNFETISKLENIINNIDIVSSFKIEKFSLDQNLYKIFYNGNPSLLVEKFSDYGVKLYYNENKWYIE